MSHDPLSSRYRRRDDLSLEEVVGETLVLDEAGGRVHQLNSSASFVLNRCDGENSVQDILEQLVEHFEVEKSVAQKDVVELIDRLRDLNLIFR